MDTMQFVTGATLLGKNVIILITQVLSVIAGVWLIFSALRSLYRNSNGQHAAMQPENSAGTVVVKFLCGTFLLAFTRSLESIQYTLFGTGVQDYRQTMAYIPVANSHLGVYSYVMELVLLWIVVISVAAIFRGILLWVKVAQVGESGGQGGSVFWKATWHVICGSIGVNLPAFVKMIFGQ